MSVALESIKWNSRALKGVSWATVMMFTRKGRQKARQDSGEKNQPAVFERAGLKRAL
jgi:hypothetical protein